MNWVTFVLVVVATVAVVGQTSVWIVRRRAWGLALLGLIALAVRLALPAMPHDINDRVGPLFGQPLVQLIGEADNPYGVAYGFFALFWGSLTGGVPWGDRVFDGTALMAALGVVAVQRWAHIWTGRKDVAWLAAGLLAFCGPHVRYAHTDAQPILEVTFMYWALWQLEWLGRRPSALRAVAAMAALGSAVLMRPESALSGGVAFLLFAAKPGRSWAHWKRTLPVWLGAGAVGLVGLAMAQAHLETTEPGSPWSGFLLQLRLYGWRHLPFLDPQFVGVLGAPVVVVALFNAKLPLRQRVVLALSLLATSMLLFGWSTRGDSGYVVLRHALRVFPLSCLALASVLALWPEPARRPLGKGLMAALVFVACNPSLPALWGPVVLDQEWRLQQRIMAYLPQGEPIYVFNYWMDSGLAHRFTTPYLGHRGDLFLYDMTMEQPPEGALFYADGNCHLYPNNLRYRAVSAHCRWLLDHRQAEPVYVESLRLRPWFVEDYPDEPVTVGLYRLGPVPAAPPDAPFRASPHASPQLKEAALRAPPPE